MIKKIMCLITAATVILSSYGCGKKKEEKPVEETKGVNVEVFTAGIREISNEVTYTGEIKAAESVSVSAKLSAKATKVLVDEGDRVKAGDVIARLDKTDVELQYKQAEAAYNSAVANYNMINNSTNTRNSTQASQSVASAQIAYDNALSSYERELELFNQNSNVKLAEQNCNDAVSAYERAKSLYDNDINLIAARNQYQSAKENYERYSELYKIGAVSKVEYDNIKMAMENARAALESAESNNKLAIDNAHAAMISAEENLKKARTTADASVEAAKNALENATNNLKTAKENYSLTDISNQESLKTAQASVDSAHASLEIAKNNLNNTSIVAPISGYISSRNINIGQMVSPGVEIFSIKNSNTVDAEIKITESVIPDVKVGTMAVVSVKSAEIEDINGTVTLINPVKDERTGMYTVRVTINNASNKLKVGMFADVKLITKSEKDAISIPSDAVMQSGSDLYVYIANGSKAEKRLVVTGIEDNDYVQILSGIVSGDQVIVSGKEYISETNNDINIVSNNN